MGKKRAASISEDSNSDSSIEFTEVIIPKASTSKIKSNSKTKTNLKKKPPVSTPIQTTVKGEDSDDEEGAWDEVDVNQDNRASTIAAVAAAAIDGELEIVIRGNGNNNKGKGKDKGKWVEQSFHSSREIYFTDFKVLWIAQTKRNFNNKWNKNVKTTNS